MQEWLSIYFIFDLHSPLKSIIFVSGKASSGFPLFRILLSMVLQSASEWRVIWCKIPRNLRHIAVWSDCNCMLLWRRLVGVVGEILISFVVNWRTWRMELLGILSFLLKLYNASCGISNVCFHSLSFGFDAPYFPFQMVDKSCLPFHSLWIIAFSACLFTLFRYYIYSNYIHIIVTKQ